MFKSLSNSTIGREHQQKPHDVLDGNDWSALADDFRTFLLTPTGYKTWTLNEVLS
jgi:hypothetical protein